jgi:hypothetical protein
VATTSIQHVSSLPAHESTAEWTDSGAAGIVVSQNCPQRTPQEELKHFGAVVDASASEDGPVDASAPERAPLLPPSQVQQVVRAHFGLFRGCYDEGLRREPTLVGQIWTRFVVARDGVVVSTELNCTTMPDPVVVRCVVDRYKELRFPAPGTGTVTVIYPIAFSP